MTRFKVLGLVQAEAATEKPAKLLEFVALVIKRKKKKRLETQGPQCMADFFLSVLTKV